MSHYYYPDFQRHCPFRSPAWRWQRAEQLMHVGGSFSRRQDDNATGRAVSYLRDLHHCHTDQDKDKLARNYPHIHAAHCLFESDSAATAEVQARLLAGQAPADIAHTIGLSSATVATYEALFFSVMDKLQARDWITSWAVGWWHGDPATGRDKATVLRGFAYSGGVLVLEALLPYLCRGQLEAQPPATLTGSAFQLDQAIRQAIGVAMLPYDEETNFKIMKMHADLIAAGVASDQPVVAGPSCAELVADSVAEALDTVATEEEAAAQTQKPVAGRSA